MGKIFKRIRHLLFGPEISIFFEFHKPPYGGGNQFLTALEKALSDMGYDVGKNTIGKNTKACLFNSYNFNSNKLSKLKNKYGTRMIHRLAGPIGVYRDTNNDIDNRIGELNKSLADHTIFQSEYSFNKYKELGFHFGKHTIIHNSADPEIFYRKEYLNFENKKIKLIATAWSQNPKKGGLLLSWLDEHLDHERYELTFVGRTQAHFKIANIMAPVPSRELSNILRDHDIYIAPSQDDPCSNALIEALSCGLPVAFLRSGGHPELVGEAGEGFTDGPSAVMAIDKIADNISNYRSKILTFDMKYVAEEYLKILLPEK